ncbi:MAG TPA: large conductance mechanosensitive channel protein MscL [Thermoanaerobaculia bacterium]|nr:large conductance mechanosensitive channel protein MscL [Thermoanaerobaculia bacterium]
MSFASEFREFAVKGNAIDMAVGIIIGGAFGKIVTSLVNDLIMPPFGLLLGRVDFNSLFVNLGGGDYPSLDAAKEAGAPVLAYGSFLQTALDFVILAFVLFMIVRAMNRLRRKEEAAPAPAAPAEEVVLLREIRDSLKAS